MIFFLFFYLLIKYLQILFQQATSTKKKYLLERLKIKKTKDDGKDYQNIPIFYDEKNVRVRLSGRFKLKEFGDLRLVVQVDDHNRKLFEGFEEKLRTLINDNSLKWAKGDNVYLKIYIKTNRKMNVKFWELFEIDGKEYRKPIHNPENLIDKNFEGEVVFKLDKISIGKINKGKDYLKSIISVAEEVLVREVIEEESYFAEEYPVWEYSKRSLVENWDEGEDEHTH